MSTPESNIPDIDDLVASIMDGKDVQAEVDALIELGSMDGPVEPRAGIRRIARLTAEFYVATCETNTFPVIHDEHGVVMDRPFDLTCEFLGGMVAAMVGRRGDG